MATRRLLASLPRTRSRSTKGTSPQCIRTGRRLLRFLIDSPVCTRSATRAAGSSRMPARAGPRVTVTSRRTLVHDSLHGYTHLFGIVGADPNQFRRARCYTSRTRSICPVSTSRARTTRGPLLPTNTREGVLPPSKGCRTSMEIGPPIIGGTGPLPLLDLDGHFLVPSLSPGFGELDPPIAACDLAFKTPAMAGARTGSATAWTRATTNQAPDTIAPSPQRRTTRSSTSRRLRFLTRTRRISPAMRSGSLDLSVEKGSP